MTEPFIGASDTPARPAARPVRPAPTRWDVRPGQFGAFRYQPGDDRPARTQVEEETAGRARALEDIARVAGSGLTGGYSDKAVAGVRSLLGEGSYRDLATEEQAKTGAIPDPIRVIGEVAGSMATMGAGGAALHGTKVGNFLARQSGFLKATGLGALYGALFGSGTARPGEELEGGATGGLAGGATGGPVYYAARGAQWVKDRVQNILRMKFDPKGYAREQLARAMEIDKVTTGQAREQLEELGPQGMLADLRSGRTPGGEPLRGPGIDYITRAVSTEGSPSLRQRLANRTEGERERFKTSVHDYLEPKDFLADERVLIEKLAAIKQAIAEYGQQIKTLKPGGRRRGKLELHKELAEDNLREIASLKKALDQGKSFLNMSPEAVRDALASMDEAQRAAFRSGALRQFIYRTGNVKDQGSIAELFKTPNMRERIEALDAGDENWSKFITFVRNEQQMANTARGVNVRSPELQPTPGEQSTRQKAEIVGALAGSQSPVGHQMIAARIGRELARRQMTMNRSPEARTHLAEILGSQDRAHQLETLAGIDELVRTGRIPSDVARELAAELMAGATGGQQHRYVPPVMSQAAPYFGGN